MNTQTFRFKSSDQITDIHAIRWEPDESKIKGILQISHGMVEYIERYADFAEFMVGQGFLVVGNDHLGHGESVTSPENWGYFAPKDGSDLVVEDINKLRTMIQEEYPQMPYFILGHSMGSFLLRKYLSKYGRGLHGAIIMGTGTQPDSVLRFGKALCKFLAVFRGWKHRSKFIDNLIFSGNGKQFEGQEGSWLTKDVEIANQYNHDEKCSFSFTLNGFYNLFDTIYFINRTKNIEAIPKDLPLFLVSGAEDPVGNCGKGVKIAYDTYKKAGIEDISWKLYPTDRHEILNELDREDVYKDIFAWIQERM